MHLFRRVTVALSAGLALATAVSAQAGPPDSAPLQSGASGCPAGQTLCGGVCKDTSSDSSHCGSCTNVCAAGSVCSSGACQVSCGAGLTNCSGRCTNLTFDPQNCGACGSSCSLPRTSTAACVQSTCAVVTCGTGFGNCDAVAANGCETTLANDPRNCGGCGVACAAANAASSCANSACTFSCNPGFANCNGAYLDGCEVNLLSDPRNCGACGRGCPLGCMNGVCRI